MPVYLLETSWQEGDASKRPDKCTSCRLLHSAPLRSRRRGRGRGRRERLTDGWVLGFAIGVDQWEGLDT